MCFGINGVDKSVAGGNQRTSSTMDSLSDLSSSPVTRSRTQSTSSSISSDSTSSLSSSVLASSCSDYSSSSDLDDDDDDDCDGEDFDQPDSSNDEEDDEFEQSRRFKTRRQRLEIGEDDLLVENEILTTEIEEASKSTKAKSSKPMGRLRRFSLNLSFLRSVGKRTARVDNGKASLVKVTSSPQNALVALKASHPLTSASLTNDIVGGETLQRRFLLNKRLLSIIKKKKVSFCFSFVSTVCARKKKITFFYFKGGIKE